MFIEEFIIFFGGDGFYKIKEWTHGISNEITAYKKPLLCLGFIVMIFY